MSVFLPYPVEPALIAMYGDNFRQPVTDWRWSIDPFLTGMDGYY